MIDPPWHVAVTSPRAETDVSDDIVAAGGEAYVPMESVRGRRPGTRLLRPLMPRYVFFRRLSWPDVSRLDGISYLLRIEILERRNG